MTLNTEKAEEWISENEERLEDDFIRELEVQPTQIKAKFDVDFLEEFKEARSMISEQYQEINFKNKIKKIKIKNQSNTKTILNAFLKYFEDLRDENMNNLVSSATPTPQTGISEQNAFEAYGSDDDDEEDDEGWDDTRNDLYSMQVSKEKQFEIYSSEDLEKKQNKAIEDVKSTLFLSDAAAKMVLQSYKWNFEKIYSTFTEKGRDGVLQDVGLSDESFETLYKDEEHTDRSLFECPVCYDDVDISETAALPSCKHRFCNSCWKDHLQIRINGGSAKKLTCMYPECKNKVDENLVKKFVDKKELSTYEKKVNDSYVDDNKYLTWCPSVPHCGSAVYSKLIHQPLEITCTCGKEFCFACKNDPHLPSSCIMTKVWEKKCRDDSETLNWISANTKDCPDCGKATEKNGGCNHISCTCGAHWCWKCEGSFNTSTVYSHNCGGFKESDATVTSRTSLKRYMHYFDRYNVHKESRKFEDKTRDKVRKKMEEMYKYKPNSAWVETSWLQKGLDVLFITRRVLQYSYIFAYYVFDPAAGSTVKLNLKTKFKSDNRSNKQLIFENTQGNLESTVEKLAHLLELPIETICQDDSTKRDIQLNTSLNETRMKALFDIIRKELVTEGSYPLPDPPSISNQ